MVFATGFTEVRELFFTFGYALGYEYANDGTLLIQTRIPSIHGPYKITDAKGAQLKTYTRDENLPWYQSVLLPHLPVRGEIVMLQTMNTTTNEWVILGLTGGSYNGSN